MKKIIFNLRQQPEDIKRHILHFSTLVVAILLFIVWIYTLGSSIGDKEVQAKAKNDLGPITTLRDNFVNGYKSITEDTVNLLE